MSRFAVHQGEALEELRKMEDGSMHCCVTSPPYWGLRDYGVEGQLGLEATPELYVERMVAIFREVRRVLRDDGTLWLNLGDTYATGAGATNSVDPKSAGRSRAAGSHASRHYGEGRAAVGPLTQPNRQPLAGFKPKDLVGIPWMVAFALRAEGWYLRSDIVWAKPNPMPESVTDRPTKAHEYLFLLSKAPRYFFDQEAVRERHATPEARRATKTGRKALAGQEAIRPRGNMEAAEPERYWSNGGRNIRSVWDDPDHALSRRALRCLPAGAGRALHQGRDQRARGVPGVRGAVGAGGGGDRLRKAAVGAGRGSVPHAIEGPAR